MTFVVIQLGASPEWLPGYTSAECFVKHKKKNNEMKNTRGRMQTTHLQRLEHADFPDESFDFDIAADPR
jgi:hypothetical protein